MPHPLDDLVLVWREQMDWVSYLKAHRTTKVDFKTFQAVVRRLKAEEAVFLGAYEAGAGEYVQHPTEHILREER